MTDPYARLDAEESRLLAELAEVRAAKATLRRVCGLSDPPHGPAVVAESVAVPAAARATAPPTPRTGEGSPGKPEPRPASDGSGKEPGSRARDPGRLAKALRLLAAGPSTSESLAEKLGCAVSTVCLLLKSRPDLVHKPGGNRKAPWELTPEGRAAAG